jgi:hypothetical protein
MKSSASGSRARVALLLLAPLLSDGGHSGASSGSANQVKENEGKSDNRHYVTDGIKLQTRARMQHIATPGIFGTNIKSKFPRSIFSLLCPERNNFSS